LVHSTFIQSKETANHRVIASGNYIGGKRLTDSGLTDFAIFSTPYDG
jgi:hypothetical protein